MGFVGFIAALMLLLIEFLGSWWLGRYLPSVHALAIIVLVIAIISIFASVGVLLDKKWGWPFMLITFCATLANGAWLYVQGSRSITLAGMLAAGILGVLISFIGVDIWRPSEAMAALDMPVTTTPPPKKKAKPRKKKT